MNGSENTNNSSRSMFGSILNNAKSMIEDRSKKVRDNQEMSQLLSRLSNLEKDLTERPNQLFFDESFGRYTDLSQKEPFVYRRCQEYRNTTVVNQSDRDNYLQKINEIKNNRFAFTQDDLRSLITEIDFYKSTLAHNDKRIRLNNINTQTLITLQNAFRAVLTSQKIMQSDVGRHIVPNLKSPLLDSVFLSSIAPIMIQMKNTYFLYPDFILVVNNNKCIIDILSPSEVKMSVSREQHVGIYNLDSRSYTMSSKIGTDSRIIKLGPEIKHYEHEKKNGQPDTRYKENNVISRTRENTGEIGVLKISILKDKTKIEFSSSQAATMLENAAAVYCIRRETSSLAGLRLLELLIASDDNNIEAKDLCTRYSQYLDEKNPVCRIISLSKI